MLPDLGNSSVVLAQLQLHLHTKHVDSKDKPIVYLKRKCDKLQHSATNVMSVIKGENRNSCEATYKLSYHTAIMA
jgi:hypothetical protein